MTEAYYHIPVMLAECMEGLNINPNGTYVDVTFGGGGHSRKILSMLDKGKLYAFDQDDDAQKNIPDDERLVFINQNFKYIKNFLKYFEALPVDGILADLGISSHQINEPERGFAHRFDAELDMRMNRSSPLSAKTVVNTYSYEQLFKVFRMYGEVSNAGKLSQCIVDNRKGRTVDTINDFKTLIQSCIPKREEHKYLSQVFQAIRIEVNDELEALEQFLTKSVEVLKPGGRLVVMSYHSLEDRMVKNLINTGNTEGKVEKDIYGNSPVTLKAIGRKPITPSEEELAVNNRSRSARLRVAEKL